MICIVIADNSTASDAVFSLSLKGSEAVICCLGASLRRRRRRRGRCREARRARRVRIQFTRGNRLLSVGPSLSRRRPRTILAQFQTRQQPNRPAAHSHHARFTFLKHDPRPSQALPLCLQRCCRRRAADPPAPSLAHAMYRHPYANPGAYYSNVSLSVRPNQFTEQN